MKHTLLDFIANKIPLSILEHNAVFKGLQEAAAEKSEIEQSRGTETQSRGMLFYGLHYHAKGNIRLAEKAFETAEALGEFEVVRGNKVRAKPSKNAAEEIRRAYEFIRHPPLFYTKLTPQQCRAYDVATERLAAAGYPVQSILGGMQHRVGVTMSAAPTGHDFAIEHPKALIPLLEHGVTLTHVINDLLHDFEKSPYALKQKLYAALTAPGIRLSTDAIDTLDVLEATHARHATAVDTDRCAVNEFIRVDGYTPQDLIAAWKNTAVRKQTIEPFDFETFATRTDTRHNLVDIVERVPRPLTEKEEASITERYNALFSPEDDGLFALQRSIRLAYISSRHYPTASVLIEHAPARTAARFSALVKHDIAPSIEGIAVGFMQYHRELRAMANSML